MTEITKIFIERALFFLEYAASEQVLMYCYLSMLKTDIHEFVLTQMYSHLSELQSFAQRRDLEIETPKKEKRKAPVQTQLALKQFKPTDS